MKAHELLSDKSKWTQKAFARNEKGDVTFSGCNDAVCFCILGAIRRCYYNPHDVVAKIEAEIQCEADEWNDTPGRTFEEVHELLKRLDV